MWNFIWIASFSSLKSGLHSYTRTCLLLSRSLLPLCCQVQETLCLHSAAHSNMSAWKSFLLVAFSGPGVLSHPLTSQAILSIYFASFSSSTKSMNMSFLRLNSRESLSSLGSLKTVSLGSSNVWTSPLLLWAPGPVFSFCLPQVSRCLRLHLSPQTFCLPPPPPPKKSSTC